MQSHPSWVRGLKLLLMLLLSISSLVAPLVGAGIETDEEYEKRKRENVAPLVGAWIETLYGLDRFTLPSVAPLVGAWIETFAGTEHNDHRKSHPSWVRGLKHNILNIRTHR